MKYAAKRTWPEKQKAWDYLDDAETAEAFALEFASKRKFGLDTEFVVIEKEGDEDIRLFRVTGTSPYQITSAEPGAAGNDTTHVSVQETAESTSESLQAPSLSPVISMLFYMGKVGLIATLAIALMIPVIAAIKRTFH